MLSTYSAEPRRLGQNTFTCPPANGLVRLWLCKYARLARLRISQLVCSWDLPYSHPRHAGDTEGYWHSFPTGRCRSAIEIVWRKERRRGMLEGTEREQVPCASLTRKKHLENAQSGSNGTASLDRYWKRMAPV